MPGSNCGWSPGTSWSPNGSELNAEADVLNASTVDLSWAEGRRCGQSKNLKHLKHSKTNQSNQTKPNSIKPNGNIGSLSASLSLSLVIGVA